MMGRIALAGVLLCATSLAVGAQAPVARKADLQAKLARQALTFFVARGPEDSCGPGCRDWIAADGQFDEGSAARFRAFLARVKPGRLPVFFNSNGGLQEEAMAIGRILRERGMRAGVVGDAVDLIFDVTPTRPFACRGSIRSCERACSIRLAGR